MEQIGFASLPQRVPDDAEKTVPSEHQVTFARNFKAARLAAGMTQQDVARVTGTKYQTVSKIERGILNLTLDTMDRMARAVGCELVVLLKPGSVPPTN